MRMGLLWRKIKSVFKKPSELVKPKPLATGDATLKILTKGARETLGKEKTAQLGKMVGVAGGLAVIGVGASVVGGISGAKAVGAKIVKVIGKKAVSVAVKHPLGTLFGAGLLATEGGRKFVKKIPGKVFGAGEFTGEVLEKIEEGEVLPTTGEILVGAGLLGGAIIGGTLLYEKLTDDKKEEPPIDTTPESLDAPGEQLIKEKPVGVADAPMTQETQTITTGKKRYKRRRAIKTPSMRQSVRVNIINSPRHTNKTFINERLLIC